MKKIITVVIFVLLALGLGWYLFKISPQDQRPPSSGINQLDTSKAKPLSTPPAFDSAADHFQGDAKAKNVFVEYADMQCPACAVFSEILKQVPTQFTDTVFVFRYFPLVQIHKNTVISSLALEAAGAQGKFWEMHDILFKKQTDWKGLENPLDAFAGYAQEAGVSNIDQFKSDVTTKKYLAKIEKDNNEAIGLNLQGTPTMFFNGRAIKNGTIDDMKKEAEQYYIK